MLIKLRGFILKNKLGCLSLLATWILFLVIRFPLFNLYFHHMKEWPYDLACFISGLIIILSTMKLNAAVISLPISYFIGFWIGYFLQHEPTDPCYDSGQWLIWTVSILVMLGISVVANIIYKMVKKK